MKKSIIGILSIITILAAAYFVFKPKPVKKCNVKYSVKVKNNITTVKWSIVPIETIGYIISYKRTTDTTGFIHKAFVDKTKSEFRIRGNDILVTGVSRASCLIIEKAEVVDIDIISLDSSEVIHCKEGRRYLSGARNDVADIESYFNNPSTSFAHHSRINQPGKYFSISYFQTLSDYTDINGPIVTAHDLNFNSSTFLELTPEPKTTPRAIRPPNALESAIIITTQNYPLKKHHILE